MPHEINCPRCATALRVAPDETGRWLTCPRCLASVPNPNRDEGVVERPSPRPAPEGDYCPECGEPVRSGWRRCPSCDALLRRPAAARGRSLDLEVKRDSVGAIVVTAVMGALVLLGAVLFFATDSASVVAQASGDNQTIFAVLGLVVFAVVAGVLVLVWAARNPTVSIVSGVLGGVLLGALGVVLLICVAIQGIINTCKCN